MDDWPKIEGARIVEVGRSFVGVPYHHDGRSRTGGVDCAGLLVCVLQDLGVPVLDEDGAGQGDIYEAMCKRFAVYCDEVALDDLRAGDALIFRSRRMFNHVGLYDGGGGMIHAYSSAGRVVACPLDASWRKRLVRVYRYKGAVS